MDPQIKHRSTIAAIVFLFLIVMIYCLWYGGDLWNSFGDWLGAKAENGRFDRDIGTNKDIWINGYLGIFFRFKRFGVLNWLAIPICIYFLMTIKNRERWEIAVAFVLIVSCSFIAVKGYVNHRYQLTNYPPLLAIVFLFGWVGISRLDRKKKYLILTAVVCISLLCAGFMIKKFYSYGTKNGSYWKGNLYERILGGPFPYDIFEYIDNKLPADSVITGDTKILLYHYYDKPSLFKQAQNKNGKQYVFRLLKNKDLPGRYLICDDQKYKLYQIEPAEQLRIDIYKTKPDFEFNFINQPENGEVPMKKISETAPPLSLFESRGDFVFKRIDMEDINSIRIRSDSLKLYESPGIQFGFFWPDNEPDLNVEEGDLVGLEAFVRVSEKFFSEPELFIQDKTEKGWSRETIPWSRGDEREKWENVFIIKKIRRGVTHIQMGIVWEPESDKEWIEIRKLRIYVKKTSNVF